MITAPTRQRGSLDFIETAVAMQMKYSSQSSVCAGISMRGFSAMGPAVDDFVKSGSATRSAGVVDIVRTPFSYIQLDALAVGPDCLNSDPPSGSSASARLTMFQASRHRPTASRASVSHDYLAECLVGDNQVGPSGVARNFLDQYPITRHGDVL